MSLRGILECSIPDEPGYQAPKAVRPLDEPAPDYTEPPPGGLIRQHMPPLGDLAVAAVRELGIASVRDVVTWLEHHPEARLAGEMTEVRVRRLLNNGMRKGLLRQMTTTGAWTPAGKK
jgi:hypothetical protein